MSEPVIAGLTPVNAVVSEDAQRRPLQDRAKESKFTLRFFPRQGEKVAAGGAPVPRIKKGIQSVVHGGENRGFFVEFVLDALVFGGSPSAAEDAGARAIFALKQKNDRTRE
jgi:hypothetical protein